MRVFAQGEDNCVSSLPVKLRMHCMHHVPEQVYRSAHVGPSGNIFARVYLHILHTLPTYVQVEN